MKFTVVIDEYRENCFEYNCTQWNALYKDGVWIDKNGYKKGSAKTRYIQCNVPDDNIECKREDFGTAFESFLNDYYECYYLSPGKLNTIARRFALLLGDRKELTVRESEMIATDTTILLNKQKDDKLHQSAQTFSNELNSTSQTSEPISKKNEILYSGSNMHHARFSCSPSMAKHPHLDKAKSLFSDVKHKFNF